MNRQFTASIFMWAALVAVPAAGQTVGQKATDFECSVSAVTCGTYVTTATETEVCGVLELAKVGNLPAKAYTELTFFIGMRAGGEVLFLGGASVKGGLTVSCRCPWDEVNQRPAYSTLKRELPALLQANPEIKKRFPQVKAIVLDDELSFEPVKPGDKIKIRKLYKEHRWRE